MMHSIIIHNFSFICLGVISSNNPLQYAPYYLNHNCSRINTRLYKIGEFAFRNESMFLCDY